MRRSMRRALDLVWLATAASCLTSNHDDTSPRAGIPPSEVVAPLGDERALGPREVQAALWPNLRGTPYTAPDAARVRATATLMTAAIAHARGEADAESLPALAHAAGLVVERWRIDDQRYLAVLEGSAARGSTGAFVLRMGARTQSERLMQAPHAFHDKGTGELALAVFLTDSGLRGLFTNTLHRYVQADGHKQRRADNPADVCHNDAHAFVAATMAAVRSLGDVEVVQLHGFADEHALREMTAWAVVSAGDAEGGSTRVTEVCQALQQAFGGPFARYPEDVDELGGTANAIGQRVREEPSARFLHVEMSSTFRTELLRRSDGPARLAAALGVRQGPPPVLESP